MAQKADGTAAAPDVACGCGEWGDAREPVCYCDVDDLMRIIRRRYSLAVLNVIHRRVRVRYHDIAALLPAISSSTLAETLHALTAASLVSRSAESEHRQVQLYALTDTGTVLLNRLRALLLELE